MSQAIDLVRSSLPSSEQLVLEAVEETTRGVVLQVRAKYLPRCPACFKCRVSYHSRYARRVRDLPWQGRQVEIHLQTRRFRCLNKECARKIFAESLPAVAARKARETVRLCETVGLVGYALGGLPGERLLNRLGITSSDDTVLRRVKGRRRGAIQPAVRVLSVDDWAWRKKQRYGTMLMDLERSQVIDLLPERSANSFARWLGLHPEVQVITRDRSSLYADGGRQGASSAVQITDRYGLKAIKFLGFSFTASPEAKRVIAPQALDRFKQRIREITRRAKGVSMKTTIEELAPFMRGWRSYFGFCETPEVLVSLTRWVRLRIRAAMWRQWKTPRRRREALIELGVRSRLASNTAGSGLGPWYLAKAKALSVGLSNAYLRSLGLPSLVEE